MSNQIRVRIAPSPTGPFHIGNARAALFNWLFAKKNNGVFILRIEDTDLERSNIKFEENIKDSLNWLNLEWDEFYKQSERLDIYKKYLQKLLNEEKAFWCYHSIEELKKEGDEQMKHQEAPRHICEHKYKEPKNKDNGIIRLKVNENSTRAIHFNDIIRGTVEWQEKLIGDLSLAKNLDTPLYNFTVVIDDHETKISHVIRGEDHISNTPKQILIQEALEIKPPQYAHLSLILGPDRTKLSKRHGAESVQEYKDMGYLPEAMINFMSLLGWHPSFAKALAGRSQGKPEDIYFIDELITLFDLKDVQKSPAVFDIKKLNWINGYYIHQLPPEQFRIAITPFIFKELGTTEIKDEYLDKIQHLMTERMEKLSDIKNFDYFFKEPRYDRELLKWKNLTDEEIKKSLTLTKEVLEPVDWDKDYIRKKLDDLAKEKFNRDRGAVYWPLRVALTGKQGSPDPLDILEILPKEIIIKRLNDAIWK